MPYKTGIQAKTLRSKKGLVLYNKIMQKIATKVFICASVLFGVLGIFLVITGIDPGDDGSTFEMIIGKLFISNIFVILSSFALSVAGKYLNNNS